MYSAIDILLSTLCDLQNRIVRNQKEMELIKKCEIKTMQSLEDDRKALDDIKKAIIALGGNPDHAPRSLTFNGIGTSTSGEHMVS